MKKIVLVMAVFMALGLVMGACSSDDDGGGHCEPISNFLCDPVCDIMAGEVCCDLECVEMATCDPECDVETSYCDPCTGNCVALCDPECPAAQYCDDGTCKDLPVCDPVCAEDEVCVP